MNICLQASEAADSSLNLAKVAGEILYSITDEHFHFCNEEKLNTSMAEAVSMLTEEETNLFRENLRLLIEQIDKAFTEFPEIEEIYNDAGVHSRVYRALHTEMAEEDWHCIITVFERAIL